LSQEVIAFDFVQLTVNCAFSSYLSTFVQFVSNSVTQQIAVRSESQAADVSSVGWKARVHKLDRPAPSTAIRTPTFLIGTGLADLVNDLSHTVELALQGVIRFLCQTPLYVIVGTLYSAVHTPASRTSD
jgi:hypothetical protein